MTTPPCLSLSLSKKKTSSLVKYRRKVCPKQREQLKICIKTEIVKLVSKLTFPGLSVMGSTKPKLLMDIDKL